MQKTRSIHLWRCDLTLHDHLFFATARRNRMSETGQFIHNYSLTYALGWAKSGWYTERREPKYAEQLSKIKGIYVTPAKFLSGEYTILSQRTETEGYAPSIKPNSGTKSYNSIRCLRPGSMFRFYVLAGFHLDKIPRLIRLGRLMAKAEIKKQQPVEIEVDRGDCAISSLLNWGDMAVEPNLCDVIVYALPGRLIDNARFAETSYLSAVFSGGETAKLPLEMGYFQKELCSSWMENGA